jgi:N-acyl-D-amino-acid deacylase
MGFVQSDTRVICYVFALIALFVSVPFSAGQEGYDLLLKNGHILDGSGNPWYLGDVAVKGDRIVAIGKVPELGAKRIIDASGLIIAPGFIDMLGHSELALLVDNRSLSKLSQGITTEIAGEGTSIAPQNANTQASLQASLLKTSHGLAELATSWKTLDEYFQRLQQHGTPINIGTYVGAAQVREAAMGSVDRLPTAAELSTMEALVADSMRDGALGLSTALIYPPGYYAKTEELIALAKVVSQFGGLYATHIRGEGQAEAAAIDEAVKIGREAKIPVEIFHLKVIGSSRWGSMPLLVRKLQEARDSGVDIGGDIYPYVAGASELASALPPWVADGGVSQLLRRLDDPSVRAKIKLEMATDHPDWDNLYIGSGGALGVTISAVSNAALKQFEGKNLAEVAAMEGKDPIDTLLDLVRDDRGLTWALYFLASDEDLQFVMKQPWVSVGTDSIETSLDGPLFTVHGHPRSFGSMNRFLGHYVRDLHVVPLPDAIRKITSLPAQRIGLVQRGLLKPGFFADITLFDPEVIDGLATYLDPNRLSGGIKYVLVNGQLEYENGKLTGAMAGRPLRGPGWVHSARAGTPDARDLEGPTPLGNSKK